MVPLDDGIVRITFPLPLGIDHVHAYVIPGDDGAIVVDTGLGLPGAHERWQRILEQVGQPARIVVTHFHPDHVGAAAIVAEVADAPVSQGVLDYEYCRRAWTGEAAAERSEEHMVEHGIPADEAAAVRAQQEQLTGFVHYARDPDPLEPGDSVGGWEVLHLPGHADGHLALLRDGVLIAGDALLGGITPNVGLWPASAPDPLSDYLGSLARIADLDPELALPGHGERILDPAGRANEIVEHHEDRLRRTLAELGPEPRSGYDISRTLFPDALAPPLRRFAVAETLAHLEYLVHAGRATRIAEDGRTTYAA